MELGTRQHTVVRERRCQFHVIQVKPFKSSEPIMEDSPLLSVTNMGILTGALIACRIPQLAFFKEGKKIKQVAHDVIFTLIYGYTPLF